MQTYDLLGLQLLVMGAFQIDDPNISWHFDFTQLLEMGAFQKR